MKHKKVTNSQKLAIIHNMLTQAHVVICDAKNALWMFEDKLSRKTKKRPTGRREKL